MVSRVKFAALAAAGLTLAGCAEVGPNYRLPTKAVVNSTVKLVCSEITAAMAPTRRMSAVRSQRSRAHLKCTMQRPASM